jgi:hypothetical protein
MHFVLRIFYAFISLRLGAFARNLKTLPALRAGRKSLAKARGGNLFSAAYGSFVAICAIISL